MKDSNARFRSLVNLARTLPVTFEEDGYIWYGKGVAVFKVGYHKGRPISLQVVSSCSIITPEGTTETNGRDF